MISNNRTKKTSLIASLLVVFIIIFSQSCMRMRTNRKSTKVFFETAGVPYIDTTFKNGKNRIHYIETGSPKLPTLVFVHGSPGSWDAFKNYLKDSLLLKKYRMIAIDRPGFGYSHFGKALSLEAQTNYINSFIKSKDNKMPIVLVGHSMGGPVIASLAANNPKIYSHLIVLSGALDPKAETPEKWRSVIKAFPLRYLIPGALRPSNDELWWLKKDLVSLQPKLKNIISEVTVIHGTKDPLVPFSNVAFIEKEMINAKSMKVVSVLNANHFIPWEHYSVVLIALLNLKL